MLATGVEDVFPECSGFDDHYGTSVFHCPACDGYEARDCDVVAIGWDAHLVGFAATLLNWARSVTVVSHARPFAGDDAYRAAWDRVVAPVVRAFGPDAIVAQCGVDHHHADPLSHMLTTMPLYRELWARLRGRLRAGLRRGPDPAGAAAAP